MPISAHTEKIVRILDSMFAYRYYTYKQIEDRLFEKGIELGTRQIQNIMTRMKDGEFPSGSDNPMFAEFDSKRTL